MTGSSNLDGTSNKMGNPSRRIGRRTVIEAALATSAGLVLGTTYVTPDMTSVGLAETQAVVSGATGTDPSGKGKAKEK